MIKAVKGNPARAQGVLADVPDGEMYCALMDGKWYVLAPYNGAFSGPGGAADIPVSDYPLKVEDCSDANWEHGVLNWDYKTVAFADTPFARRRIEGMRALRAGETQYVITEISYRDAGTIMVTLDIEDARVLHDVPLEGLP